MNILQRFCYLVSIGYVAHTYFGALITAETVSAPPVDVATTRMYPLRVAMSTSSALRAPAALLETVATASVTLDQPVVPLGDSCN